MSFCNSNNADRCPGNISGNPLNGLCEKVCIQVKKVFDACISQMTLETLSVTLTDLTPASPAEPLTFVSGKSTSSKGTITALTVTPLADRPGLSRVLATVSIPVQITYTDANGVEGTGTGTVAVTEDIVMCVPTGSVFPVELAATVNMASPNGVYVSGTTFSITACTTVVMKVLADVDLLVPSYGYCKIPPCTAFSQEVCQGVFDLPLFPR
ncbi:MAG TPA: hypothetical protein IAD51_05120 [Candidatus Limadaptatus stercorigallinarum]|uniref:Uncharacterized protein n=1 Tax=Candidatus Limadaptatus stercorigallinarum TaxID=2840845 RepID=A0A9D1HUJ2_9FIRM|nr:hypothetical protein [Christensenellales bacterium]HIU21595.1 hypothetical protein [Candidatus Limadaptatus stercorigallinarum]